MSSDFQHSTGPRTEAGKAISSRNALTLGLYTCADYVQPDEHEIYKSFCETMHAEFAPNTLIEESLTAEITAATWRLRRCSAAEATLVAPGHDPLLDDKFEKTLRSIERARASSHSILHRSLNQFRRLQTDRLTRQELLHPNQPPAYMGIADADHINSALNNMQRGMKAHQQSSDSHLQAQLDSIMAEPAISPEFASQMLAVRREMAGESNEEDSSLGSFCESADLDENAAPAAPEEPAVPAATPRNALCPCRSGEKFKRCCGRNSPAVLSTPRKRAA